MNLGQALAMMQYANQAKDYTNRYKATPTLDWADIASAPVEEYGAMQPPVGQSVPPQFGGYPPIGEAIAGYAPPPTPDMAVAGYAPPQPPIEQRGVPAFMADQTFSELYGAPAQEPPSRITPMAFTPSPTEPTGVYGAMPSFTPPTPRMAMAPLPIPGRPVPPTAMTDAPTSEMIEPGRSVALAQVGEGEAGQMLRPNTPSQFKPFRVEVPAVPKTPFDNIQPQQVQQPVIEEKPKYEPGQPFPVTLNVGGETMTGNVVSFTPPTANARPRAIKFIPMDAEGKAGTPINIPASNQELYRQVDEQYRSLISSTAPTPAEDEIYKSQVKIGDNWVKARVDEDTGEVFYPINPNKPQLGEAKFGDSIKDIVPGENYKGPVNQYGQEDLTQISNARKRVSEFMESMIRTLSSTATGYEGGLTAEELSRNITPKFIPGEEKNPLGEIQWMVRNPRTNEELTLEEAADILPAGLAQKLQDSFNQLKQMSDEIAAGAMSAQSAQAPSMRQSVMDTMDQQLAQLQGELAAATTAAESTRIQRLIDQKQRDRLNFMASNAAGITGPGGATVFEAPQAATGYTLNPNTLTGRLQLISGVNPVPGQYQQGSGNAIWTMEGLAEKIKQDALENVRSNAITIDPEYNSAVRVLSGIMRRIQSDAFEQFGEDASNILNQDATFYYYDREDGRIATVVMPYKQAVDNFNSYSQAYKQALRSGDPAAIDTAKTNLANAGKVLSGAVVIPELGRYFPANEQDTLSLQSLSNIQDLIRPPLQTDMALPGITAVAGGTKTSEAPKSDVVRPPSTQNQPTTSRQKAWPLYNSPTGNVIQLDSSSNVFDEMSKTEVAYARTAANFSKNESEATTNNMLSRLMFKDGGGTLTNEEINDVNTTLSNFKKNIVGDNGFDARSAYVKLLFKISNDLDLGINPTEQSVINTFENIRTVAKNGGNVDAAIKQAMDLVFGGQVNGRPAEQVYQDRLARGFTGGVVDALSSAGQNYQYIGKLPIAGGGKSQTRLYDNIKQAWYELATLFAAAGTGATQYGNVSWLYNPTDPNQVGMHTPFTIPTAYGSNTATTFLPYEKIVNKDTNVTATTGVPIDPAYSVLIKGVNQLFATNYQDLQSLMVKSAGPIINRAKANHRVDLEGNSPNVAARKGYTNTFIDKDVETGIAKKASDMIFLSNLFSKNRDRNILPTNTTTLPKFNTQLAK